MFYILNKNGLELILSILTLKKFKIKINYKIYIWRFNVGKPSFILKKINKFFKTLGTAAAVYILIFLKLLLIKTTPVYFINIIITEVFLPGLFKKIY